MKKLFLLFSLVMSLSQAKSQSVEILTQSNKLGLQVLNYNNTVYKRIEPIYEELRIYTNMSFGGISLGEQYQDAKYWSDTEYVETPIDPDDLNKTKIDTFVNTMRPYFHGKLVQAKKNGKWGLIDFDGKEILPFVYNDMMAFKSSTILPYKKEALPYIVLFGSDQTQMVNQQGELVLDGSVLPTSFKNLNNERKLDVLAICYFGDYLLVNEGGRLYDTLIKVPAVRKTVNGKTKLISAAYKYNRYYFVGGKMNVWQFSTQKFLYAEPKYLLEVHFKDESGADYYEALNVRNYNSILKFTENSGLNLIPAKIEFTIKE
jgi:hypothetical protein